MSKIFFRSECARVRIYTVNKNYRQIKFRALQRVLMTYVIAYPHVNDLAADHVKMSANHVMLSASCDWSTPTALGQHDMIANSEH